MLDIVEIKKLVLGVYLKLEPIYKDGRTSYFIINENDIEKVKEYLSDDDINLIIQSINDGSIITVDFDSMFKFINNIIVSIKNDNTFHILSHNECQNNNIIKSLLSRKFDSEFKSTTLGTDIIVEKEMWIIEKQIVGGNSDLFKYKDQVTVYVNATDTNINDITIVSYNDVCFESNLQTNSLLLLKSEEMIIIYTFL